jgi:hypothetical protein
MPERRATKDTEHSCPTPVESMGASVFAIGPEKRPANRILSASAFPVTHRTAGCS